MKEQILNQNTILTKLDGTPYLRFPAFMPFEFLAHGFSTRFGGVSKGVFASMNLGFHRGDEDCLVRENFKRICSSIGVKTSSLVFTDQVHQANIFVATKKDCGKGYDKPRDYKEMDAVITCTPGVTLLVYAADCVPIFLVDPVKQAIGLVHSGWRGTVLQIAVKTIHRMEEEFGCEKKNIVAVIGPCICKDCYEVSADVALRFMEAFPKESHASILFPKNNEKYQLDLWEANRFLLKSTGLKQENIVVSELCTMCHSQLLFSHRKTNGQRGSMAGFLQIRDPL